MSTSETRQDFAALQWVTAEIAQTADETAKAILGFADNLSDQTRLRQALTFAHQLHATLRLLGVRSAEQLALEVELTVQAMLHGAIAESEANLQLLLAATLQLPGYLRRVANENHESPASIIGMINELRVVRGDEAFPVPEVEDSLDLGELSEGSGKMALRATDEELLLLRRARQRFQTELLGLLKGEGAGERLGVLQKLFALVWNRLRPGGQRAFWQACEAVCSGLDRGGLPLDGATQNLLRELDNEFKASIALELRFYERAPDAGLYRRLIKLIGTSQPVSPVLVDIQRRHRLMPGVSTGKSTSPLEDLGATLAAVDVIGSELALVLGRLETTEGDAFSLSRILREVAPDLRRIANMLAGLGFSDEHEILEPQIGRIESDNLSGTDLDDRLTEISAALLDVDQRLATRAVDSGRGAAGAMELRQHPLTRALVALYREVQAGLEQIKQAVGDYLNSESDVQLLAPTANGLHAIAGALRLANLPVAAELLAECKRFIVATGTPGTAAPGPRAIDLLADALSSVEYFVERLAIDKRPAELILARARESIEALFATAGEAVPHEPPVETPAAAQSPPPDEVPVVVIERGEPTVVGDYLAAMVEVPEPAVAETPPVPEPTMEFDAEIVMAEPVVEPEPEVVIAEPIVEPEPEPEAVVAVSAPAVETQAETIDELDPEILEIFVEEVAEVLGTIGTHYPYWAAQPAPGEALTELRRAFHTLKGSGRMVGANVIAELAWSVENLLNRILDGALVASADVVEVVGRAYQMMPELVEAFAHRRPLDRTAVEWLGEAAQALARKEAVRWPEAAAAVVPAAVTVEEELETLAVEDAAVEAIAEQAVAERIAEVEAAEPDVEEAIAAPVAEELVPVVEEPVPLGDEPAPLVEEEPAAAAAIDDWQPVLEAEELVEAEPEAEIAEAPSIPEPTMEFDAEIVMAEPAAEPEPEVVMAEPVAEPEPEIAMAESVVEPEPEAVVAVSAPAVETQAETIDELDPEILEIFVEEVAEVLGTIGTHYPYWAAQPAPGEALTELRRAFHTLKGSGRMVGANVIGELAWSVENLLNRILDGALVASADVVEVVGRAYRMMPELVEAFAHRRPLDRAAVEWLGEAAQALARKEAVRWPDAAAPVAEELVPVVEEPVTLVDEPPPLVEEEPAAAVASDDWQPVLEAEELAAAELAPEFEMLEETLPELPMQTEWAAGELDATLSAPDLDAEPLIETDFAAVLPEVQRDPLMQIFAEEAADNVQVLRDFLLAPEFDKVPETLLRALHTLRGSSRTAGVEKVGAVADSLERLAQQVNTARRGLVSTEIELLGKFVDWLAALIANDFNESAETASTAAVLHEEAGAALLRIAVAKPAGDARTRRFLEESLERLFHASKLVESWCADGRESDRIQLVSEIDAIHQRAQQIELTEIVALSAPLLTALGPSASEPGTPVVSPELARRAVDAFMNLMDRLAAGQPIEQPIEIIGELHDYLESRAQAKAAAPPPVEVAEVRAPEASDQNLLRARVARDLAQAETELLDIFMEEAEELLIAIDETIDAWRHDRANREPFDNLQRHLHTLKGGARMAGLKYLGDLSHNFETFVINQHLHFGSFDDAFFAKVLDQHEQLLRTIDMLRARPEVVEAIAELLPEPVLAAPEPVTVAAEPAAVTAPEPVAEQVSEPEPEPEPKPAIAAFAADDRDTLRDTVARDLAQAETELLDIFMEEAEELMVAIDRSIEAWRADRGNREPCDSLQRHLHTLKGGARMAGLKHLGDLSHEFESFVIARMQQPGQVDDAFFARVLAAHDQLLRTVDMLRSRPSLETRPVVPEPIATPPAPIPEVAAAAAVEAPAAVPAPKLPIAVVARPPQQVIAQRKPEKVRDEVVRVAAHLLEELVNLAGETSISRGRVEEQVSELGFLFDDMQGAIDRLQSQVRRLDIATQSQILYRRERADGDSHEGFDPLEMDRYSQLQQLSRSLVESASDLLDIKRTLSEKTRDLETVLIQQSRINSQLQEGLMRSRMVPFSSVMPRLKRVVRQVATEVKKNVELEAGNLSGELDRGILERIVAPLEHMLRNAVDHGIEAPDLRKERRKPERGTILLEIAREGGDVVVSLSDDGGGVNLAAVRKKAIERGLMAPDSTLSDHEVVQFILHSGFSTAATVTQISGRGVGMDVVSSEIRQMGGSLEIQTNPGHGSRFTVRLPFTVSVSRALMVIVGAEYFALPLNTVEGVVRMRVEELEQYSGPNAVPFQYAGQRYQVRYLGALLYPGQPVDTSGLEDTVPVVLVRGGGQALAVEVDRLVGAREIVVKGLGPQFGAVPGLSGATVLGDGSVVLILDIPAILRSDAALIGADAEAQQVVVEPEKKESIPLIMVVDDSVTVRKVTTRFLEREGMRVVTAKDGADAMAQLQEMVPDLMLLDIEMPHMDGFEVVSKVRINDRLRNIPIIMITSRTGEKHRERALALGANSYLGKPYQESVLMEHINQLLHRKSH